MKNAIFFGHFPSYLRKLDNRTFIATQRTRRSFCNFTHSLITILGATPPNFVAFGPHLRSLQPLHPCLYPSFPPHLGTLPILPPHSLLRLLRNSARLLDTLLHILTRRFVPIDPLLRSLQPLQTGHSPHLLGHCATVLPVSPRRTRRFLSPFTQLLGPLLGTLSSSSTPIGSLFRSLSSLHL